MQSTELRMIGVDDPAGLRICVARHLGLDRLLELAIEMPEHDPPMAGYISKIPWTSWPSLTGIVGSRHIAGLRLHARTVHGRDLSRRSLTLFDSGGRLRQ
jgi:hypothetical protein